MIDREKAKHAIEDLLASLGVDERGHTLESPERVAAAWAEALAGYDEDPAVHLRRQFDAPADPGLVVVSGVRFASTCAHHLLPIVGIATVSYRPRPGERIVGLSKLARVVHTFARRLQVQEQLGYQIASAVDEVLAPVGSMCAITASHGCMQWRGITDHGTYTTTCATVGEWAVDSPDVQLALAEHRSHYARGSASGSSRHDGSVATCQHPASW